MDTVPSYTQLAQGYTPSLSQTSTLKNPEVQRKQPQKSTPTTDTFNATEEARKPTPQTKPKKEAPPWAMIIGGTLALGGLFALGVWQEESITKWLNLEKVLGGGSSKNHPVVNGEKTKKILSKMQSPLTKEAEKRLSEVSEILPLNEATSEALKQMHAVFDQRIVSSFDKKSPDKPTGSWYKLKVNRLGEEKETTAETYLEGVGLVKDAKKLYLGDLHGSWLKALLQLAQMEAIVMPKNTAKEFLSIHEAFQAVEQADIARVNKLLIHEPTAEMVAFQKSLKKARLQTGQNDSQKADKEFLEKDLARLRSKYSFTSPETKKEVHALVKRFKEALATVDLVTAEKQLNLVGDVLGDRGQLDLFTLLLVDKFKKNINIVTSNHDFFAVTHLIKFLSQEPYYNTSVDNAYLGAAIFDQSQSSGRLLIDAQENRKKLLGTEKVDDASFNREETIQLYKDYFSRLKLIHYDADDHAMMLHYLVTTEVWQKLVTLLDSKSPLANESSRKSLTSEALTHEVDALNTAFQQRIMAELSSNASMSKEFKILKDLLEDEIWSHNNNKNTGLQTPSFPSFGDNVKHVMIGHESTSHSLKQEGSLTFHELDNSALKAIPDINVRAQYHNASPVVIVK